MLLWKQQNGWRLICSISPFCLAEAMKDLPPILPAMLMNWAQSPAPIPNTSLQGVLFLYPQLLFLAQVTEVVDGKGRWQTHAPAEIGIFCCNESPYWLAIDLNSTIYNIYSDLWIYIFGLAKSKVGISIVKYKQLTWLSLSSMICVSCLFIALMKWAHHLLIPLTIVIEMMLIFKSKIQKNNLKMNLNCINFNFKGLIILKDVILSIFCNNQVVLLTLIKRRFIERFNCDQIQNIGFNLL